MGVKISQLDNIINLQDGCCLPIVSDGETRKINYGTLKDKLQNDLDFSYVIDSLAVPSSTNAPSINAVNEALNGTVLYENSTGTPTTFTTSDNPSNYKKLEIISSIGVYFIFPQYHNQMTISSITYADIIYYYSLRLYLNDTGFTIRYNKSWYQSVVKENENLIYKVIGYK